MRFGAAQPRCNRTKLHHFVTCVSVHMTEYMELTRIWSTAMNKSQYFFVAQRPGVKCGSASSAVEHARASHPNINEVAVAQHSDESCRSPKRKWGGASRDLAADGNALPLYHDIITGIDAERASTMNKWRHLLMGHQMPWENTLRSFSKLFR